MGFPEIWAKEKKPWLSVEHYSAEEIAKHFYLAGQRDMKERCAEIVKTMPEKTQEAYDDSQHSGGYRNAVREIAAAIRAME